MKKVLAFFGAFNPPTVAHLTLAHAAMEQTGREGVLFVPSKAAYIRDDQGKDHAYSDAQRLAMLCAAAQARPWMQISEIDMCQEAQPRTYHSLCRLREDGYQPALLLGSDKLPELEKGWLHVEDIAREFGIVCMTRSDDNCQALLAQSSFLQALAPYIHLVHTPPDLRQVSSTAVRQALRQGCDRRQLTQMVPGEILHLL